MTFGFWCFFLNDAASCSICFCGLKYNKHVWLVSWLLISSSDILFYCSVQSVVHVVMAMYLLSVCAMFACLAIRTFQLVFSAGTVFFSHNKSASTFSHGFGLWLSVVRVLSVYHTIIKNGHYLHATKKFERT
jgi:hypothetical protein